MVLISEYYNSAGRAPDDQIEALLASPEAMNFLRASVSDPYSPDGPEHFPVVYAKTMEMIRTRHPEIDLPHAKPTCAIPDAGAAGRPRGAGHRRTLRRGRGRLARRPARGASRHARPTGRVTGHGQPPSGSAFLRRFLPFGALCNRRSRWSVIEIRRALVLGTSFDVWEVVRSFQDTGSIDAVASGEPDRCTSTSWARLL